MRPIEVVRRVCPNARQNYLQAFETGDALFLQHNITTPLRLMHFLKEVLHESGGLTLLWESGNYTTADRLFKIFGEGNHSAGISWNEALRLVAMPMPDREKAIFERVYGQGNPTKAAELGNTRPGDGWRCRGGGLMQTTGGYNYRDMGEKCGEDFYNHPELIVHSEHALKPALAEWTKGSLNRFADVNDGLSISRAINLGNPNSTKTPNGWADRQAWLAKLAPLIKTVELVPAAPAASPAPVQPAAPAPQPVPPSPPDQSEPDGGFFASLGRMFGWRK